MAARLADAVRLAQDAAMLLERGRADEALERYREGIALTQRAAAKDAALAPAAALIGDELRSKLAAARRGGDAPATTPRAPRARRRSSLRARGPRRSARRSTPSPPARPVEPRGAARLLLGPSSPGPCRDGAHHGLLGRDGRDRGPALARGPAGAGAAERRGRRAANARARAREAPLLPEVGVLPSLALLPRDVLWDLKGQADELEARELRRRRPAAPASRAQSVRARAPVTPSERYHAVDAYDLGDAAAAAADEALEEMTLRARRWAEDAAREAADLGRGAERARLADAGEPLPPRTYGADLAALYPVPDAPGDGDAAAAGTATATTTAPRPPATAATRRQRQRPAPAAPPAPAVPAAPDLPPCRPAFCVVKYVDARECRGASAAARARTVGSYANELAVLRDLSGVFAAARIWTPRVLAYETDGDRYLVALEALLPPAFAQRPTLPAEHCVQALRWLARFHAFGHRLAASGFGDLGIWPLGGHTPLAHRPPGEVEGLERGYDRWLLAFCDEKRFRVPPNDFGARLAAQARRVDGWIADACGPRRTLVHGDFKAGNLFVEDATRRVFAIDWQWCGWGCGLHDVVYFLATTAADDFVKDFDDALWLYHYALVEELEPELRAAAPWPYPETRRLFMLAALDYVRWCFAYRLVDETPKAYKRRAAADPKDVNQGEYRRSFRRLRYLCDLAEQFLPYAESGALGVSLQDLALLDL
ncbi:hypothetical protein SO694_00137080 [Aureococcus anophagefferens]|uniref:Aminoglycoside phosphotransferase domain-containing protein n=1 Tax=Aureococcus anophagefferens TaxID=44056 RepID=A0ABR1GGF8_AURAN